ncbi:MYND finger [Trypanosoma vivax]|uniref:MYND-type domain-containing protein n=1 Tax=Trypanosoma vivax (strain Y486) TaxID=1055687 RepID=G0UAG3_TRYVY|nr:hypothetical protein TRVL_07030 [Trypanosoma vivax]KAH8617988.1 MYND finger [Trypanosoma vivax]KAH8618007.1 MYND finger [Trypanosoma vivax]CCC52796.1 conserved hypothetical protein [Trypanosoma vivax Y486]
MPVAWAFLSDGEACTEPKDIARVFAERYARWLFWVVLPRQWSRDKRHNTLYAPAFQLLFGTSDCSEADATSPAADSVRWQLLFYSLTHSCQEVLWETKGVDLVADIFRCVPAALHPSRFEAVCVTIGDTHERLGLCSTRAVSLFRARVEQVLAPLALQHAGVRWHRAAKGEPGASLDPGGYLPLFVGESVQWAIRQSAGVEDVSAPSQKGNDAVLELFPRLKRLLYTTAFRELDGCGLECPDTACGIDGRRPARLEEARGLAIENRRKRVGHIASFTVPSSYLPSSAREEQPWHVLLVQRPVVEKVEVSIESMDPGPLAPQPIGAEIHLLRDGGEVLYLQSQLCDEKSFNVVYEDMLHEDGELLVQLTPLEGIAFDDIDRYLQLVASHPLQEQLLEWGSRGPLCKGSCSAYTFPKVVYRRPADSVVRDTPIASPHVKIDVLAPRSAGEWAAAAAVLELLSHHATACAGGGYTLSRGITPVSPPAHGDACSWCGRRRDKLLRCGSCRVEMYCCKKHQALDWRGGHRKACDLWRRAREDYEKRVKPILKTSGPELPSTSSLSSAVTLMEFVSGHVGNCGVDTTPLVHVAGIDCDVPAFMSDFASRVALAADGAAWLQLRLLVCSETVAEGDHNAVYAIKSNGSIVRTPPSCVLGDVWHTKSLEGEGDVVALLRLYGMKYHSFVGNATDRNLGPFGAGAAAVEQVPSAVVCFGSLVGCGMTYFAAVAEVLADHFIGVVPVMCTESTLVNAHNTVEALFARLRSSSVAAVRRKQALLSRHSVPGDLIQLNASGMGLSAANAHSDCTGRVSGAALSAKELALSRHPNLYYFVVPCAV